MAAEARVWMSRTWTDPIEPDTDSLTVHAEQEPDGGPAHVVVDGYDQDGVGLWFTPDMADEIAEHLRAVANAVRMVNADLPIRADIEAPR